MKQRLQSFPLPGVDNNGTMKFTISFIDHWIIKRTGLSTLYEDVLYESSYCHNCSFDGLALL